MLIFTWGRRLGTIASLPMQVTLLLVLLLLVGCSGQSPSVFNAAAPVPPGATIWYQAGAFTASGPVKGALGLKALNGRDGSTAWVAATGASSPALSVRVGDVIYTEGALSQGGPEKFSAVRALDGHILWQAVVPLPDGSYFGAVTMVADATTVLLGDHQSRLYALDAATGAVRWHVDGPIGATFFPYIALGGGIAAALVPGTKDSSVRLAVYREDIGKLLWSGAEYPSSVRLTVGVNSYAVYIASDEGSPASPPLIAYDPHTGKQLWQYVQLGGIAAVTDDTVIIGNAFIANGKTDNIACFDAMTGTLLWEANGNYSQWYELSASTTAIYVPTTSNPTELAAISTATGRQLWSVKVGNYLPGEVIQEDGVAFAFLVGSQNYLGPNTPDRLVALDAQSGRIYWERDLPDDYS